MFISYVFFQECYFGEILKRPWTGTFQRLPVTFQRKFNCNHLFINHKIYLGKEKARDKNKRYSYEKNLEIILGEKHLN